MPKEGQIYLISFRMFKIVKKIALFSISIFLASIIGIFLILWIFSNELPNYRFLLNYEPPVSSSVHAGDGQLIAEFALQKRLFFHFYPLKIKTFFLTLELTLKVLLEQQ